MLIGLIAYRRYSSDGKLYASGSRDGSVKLWDGISSKCIGTISDAHEGAQVGSVTFSRSGKVSLENRKLSLNGSRNLNLLFFFSMYCHLERIRVSNCGNYHRCAASSLTRELELWANRSTAYRPFLIIQKILSCSLTKPPRVCVAGMPEVHSGNNYYRWVRFLSQISFL